MKKFYTIKAEQGLQIKADAKEKFTIPGDKSISHRAIMLSAIAREQVAVAGLLESEDVMATKAAFEAMGVKIEKDERINVWDVYGVGMHGLKKPNEILNMGNSGTSARLIMGILAGQNFETVIDGDESLRKRPMKRVTEPLTEMGAKFEFLEKDGCLPIKIIGNPNLKPLQEYRLPVASAQIKSAILLAGLYADGRTSIIEPEVSRNHTENMLRHFGIKVTSGPSHNEYDGLLTITGKQNLSSVIDVVVPADPSSAAFFAAAALMVPNSEIRMPKVSTNETRGGFFEMVEKMGANIKESNENPYGEPHADMTVRYGLDGAGEIEVPPEIAPSMIDEYPILAVLAASMDATVTMQGIGELRVKESDRIAAMEAGLKACGVKVESGKDWMTVYGTGKVKGGNKTPIKTHLDHRIAMSFIILGLIAEEPILLDDVSPINTSFPTFFDELAKLGVRYKF